MSKLILPTGFFAPFVHAPLKTLETDGSMNYENSTLLYKFGKNGKKQKQNEFKVV